MWGVLQYTTNDMLIARSADPRVASSKVSLQSVGPQHSVLRLHFVVSIFILQHIRSKDTVPDISSFWTKDIWEATVAST
jgi:hypothetical protein